MILGASGKITSLKIILVMFPLLKVYGLIKQRFEIMSVSGTFQNVEHVFVVGVGGGVPHFTDYYRHPRLGDVIISQCDQQGAIYYYCEKVLQDKDGTLIYSTKSYKPKDIFLQNVVTSIRNRREQQPSFSPWEKYIQEGLELLSTQEADYNRPPPETDRYSSPHC